MLIARLFKISNHFKRVIFFPKTKIVLTSKKLIPDRTTFKKTTSNKETFYRQYLLNSSEYANLIFREDVKTNSKPAEILNQMVQNKEDNLKDELLEHLDRELSQLHFNQICEITFLVVKFLKENDIDPFWDKILDNISKECLGRIQSWKVNEIVKMADISVQLPFYMKLKNKLLYKLLEKFLTSHEVISSGLCSLRLIGNHVKGLGALKNSFQTGVEPDIMLKTVILFYFLMKIKFIVPKECKFNLQKDTVNILQEINPVELGIIAEGLSNNFSVLENNLLNCIILKALENMETIDQIPFNSICKIWLEYILFLPCNGNVGRHCYSLLVFSFSSFSVLIQMTSNRRSSKKIFEFQEKGIKTALKFGITSIIKLAQTGEKVHYLDSNLRTLLMKEVKADIQELHLSLIIRVVYLITKLNIHDEEFLKMAVDEFGIRDFTGRRKKLLVLFLSHLSHYKIYPKNLLDVILQEEFINNFLNEGLSGISAWWHIYCSLEIEGSELLNFDLAPKLRATLYKIHRIRCKLLFPKHFSQLWKIHKTLIEMFGERTADFFKPLPHYQVGLIMKFDKNSKPQKLSQECEWNKKGIIIKPVNNSHIWIFFILTHYSDLAGNSGTGPNFPMQTQMRQLRAIGYTPILVNSALTHTKECLENLINAKLGECFKDQKSEVTI